MTFDADYCFSLRLRMGRDMGNRYSTSRKGTKWCAKQLRKGGNSDFLGPVSSGEETDSSELIDTTSEQIVPIVKKKNVRFPDYIYNCLRPLTISILHHRSIGILYS